MHHGKTGIPRLTGILDAEIHIETGTVGLSRRKGRVAGLSQIQLSSVERLTEHGQMDTSAQFASPQRLMVSILQKKLLVLEQTDLVVGEPHSGTVPRADEKQRQIHISKHYGGGVFKTGHLHAVSSLKVQHGRLSRRCGVIKGRHGPIIDKRRVVLSLGPPGQQAQYQDKPYQFSLCLHCLYNRCTLRKQNLFLFIVRHRTKIAVSGKTMERMHTYTRSSNHFRFSVFPSPTHINTRPR